MMDRTALLWGAGAAVSGVLVCLVQPWRKQFRTARLTCRSNVWLWIIPVLVVVMELLWQSRLPASESTPFLQSAGMATGDSLVNVLTWIVRGDVLSMLLAAAFLANSAGIRRGLWAGIESGFPGWWSRLIQFVLLASATAALGIPAVRFGAGGESGRWIVKLLAAPWTATAATMLLCWLFLSFEAASRGPAKARVRMAEMTGQFTARLWFVAFAGAVVLPLLDWLSADMRGILCWYTWPVVSLLAWFPFTALRSTEAGEIHTVFSVSLRRCGRGIPQLIGWAVVAGVHFFALHLLSIWLGSLYPGIAWYRAITTGVFAAAQIALATWMLGAWITIQGDTLSTAPKDRRKA